MNNFAIILIIIIFIIILGSKENFIITTNEDKLITNLYYDSENNLIKYSPEKNEINFESEIKDASGNLFYLVGSGLKNTQTANINYLSSQNIKIYKDASKKDLITSYIFELQNKEHKFNSKNPWILWPIIIATLTTCLCLISTIIIFSKK